MPGEGCASVGAGEVRCMTTTGAMVPELGLGAGFATLTVLLADEDDVLGALAADDRSVAVDAGPGADQVTSVDQDAIASTAGVALMGLGSAGRHNP